MKGMVPRRASRNARSVLRVVWLFAQHLQNGMVWAAKPVDMRHRGGYIQIALSAMAMQGAYLATHRYRRAGPHPVMPDTHQYLSLAFLRVSSRVRDAPPSARKLTLYAEEPLLSLRPRDVLLRRG